MFKLITPSIFIDTVVIKWNNNFTLSITAIYRMTRYTLKTGALKHLFKNWINVIYVVKIKDIWVVLKSKFMLSIIKCATGVLSDININKEETLKYTDLR